VERVKTKPLIAISLVAIFLTSISFGCEFVDSFHQVTALQGRVVGKNLWLFQFRWLRQSFSVSDATLTLYDYRSPAKISELKKIAAVQTNSDGAFDFGKLPEGHYYLKIDSNGSSVLQDWFEVEINENVKTTSSILIDISPIRPDCSGGHEFIEKKT
jgi:hypothetical protein